MKQTIEIEVPDGKKAIWKDNKIVFKDIKSQLPETWEEFCKYNKIKEEECYLDINSDITKANISERRSYMDRNIFPNEQSAKAHLALMQLHQLRDCYRQGWIPDWDNQKTIKICIIRRSIKKYEIEPRDWFYPTFLSFQSKDIAKEFLNNFKDLIIQAGDLI